jgi:hypothetical protein
MLIHTYIFMDLWTILRIAGLFYGHLDYFLTFGTFCVHLVHIFRFWCHVTWKIWQPWDRAKLLKDLCDYKKGRRTHTQELRKGKIIISRNWHLNTHASEKMAASTLKDRAFQNYDCFFGLFGMKILRNNSGAGSENIPYKCKSRKNTISSTNLRVSLHVVCTYLPTTAQRNVYEDTWGKSYDF